MQKTLGGDRLGSGKKMKVELHGYERSSHDMGYIWRSTMAAGTLVPFLKEVALPGDTFDIDLDCDIKTHPTVGPLFGSYKVQLDIFQAPIRLYNGLLHNNMLGIGMNMAAVKLPQITMQVPAMGTAKWDAIEDKDNSQINPSSILSYLGIRGIGYNPTEVGLATRQFNAVPLLAYWEIYKNYYANKQEEIGAVIHTPAESIIQTVDDIFVLDYLNATVGEIEMLPNMSNVTLVQGHRIKIFFTGATPNASQLIINTLEHGELTAQDLTGGYTVSSPGEYTGAFNQARWGVVTAISWRYKENTDATTAIPQISTFDLANIDTMRNDLLANSGLGSVFEINDTDIEPYGWVCAANNGINNVLSSQEGLGLKTYQSDLFNNWLQTEWIDGVGGISEVTAIDTTAGSFTLDTLNLSKKVYNMLNRIAVSGGSYDDWMDAVWAHDRYQRAESPMYMGGLIKELVFQEVVSNSDSGGQPLGTLAGKGVMTSKNKGGKIVVRVDEPSYIIGIISLTPRLDYSQGNKWDVHLTTLNDLHKPALDEIGYQDLITEQMAWWTTNLDTTTGEWIQKSAGKQPAWLNYMTNVNETRGNFAIANNEMFMTLNRRYEAERSGATVDIKDLTTYIDPSLYNFIFAETALDSQNFWAQIAVDITARRKMSAKLMPNL